MASTVWLVVLLAITRVINFHAAMAAIDGEYVPITYKVNSYEKQCIFDKFEKSDMVTSSVFVVEALNNGPPKATITFEGPIAGNPDILKKVKEADGNYNEANNDSKTLGRELKTGATNHWPKIKDSDKQIRYDKRLGIVDRYQQVDWSHAGESEDNLSTRAQIEADKKEAYRNYGRGPPPRPDDGADAGNKGDDERDKERHAKFRTITQAKVEPHEETNTIKAPGWYRMCVASDGYHALMVEMDMRSGKKMGGLDRYTGHVYTYEKRAMLDEEEMIDEEITAQEEKQLDANTYASAVEEVNKVLENQVRDTDLSATKAQVKHLSSMVMEMRKKHVDYQHRIKAHKATSERNHSSYVWSSKLETLLYMVVGGVQVYTVHRWLLGNTVLGR